jgi:hypothetical protein
MPDKRPTKPSTEALKRIARAAMSEAKSLVERNREVLKKLEALNERIAAHEAELARQRKPK